MAGYDPCSGHVCDHCWVCTNLGVCCSSVPNIKAYMSLEHFKPAKTRIEKLEEAIEADSPYPSMSALVRLDIELANQATTIVPNLSLSDPAMHQLPPAKEGDMLSKLQEDIAEAIPLERRK